MNLHRNVVTSNIKTIQLKTIDNGDVFRFAETTFDNALEDTAFYMKVNSPELKDSRIEIINVFDGQKLIRDGDRQVIKHYTHLNITE